MGGAGGVQHRIEEAKDSLLVEGLRLRAERDALQAENTRLHAEVKVDRLRCALTEGMLASVEMERDRLAAQVTDLHRMVSDLLADVTKADEIRALLGRLLEGQPD